MIAKQDVLLLLTELQNNGINVDTEMETLMRSNSIPLDILKKINDSRSIDILDFYEKIRKSYNQKRSKMYINIMKSDENILEDPKTILTTLSALLNQILQFKPSDQTMFYKHSRCDEIVKVLDIYFKTFDLAPAMKLLKMFKADIKVLEMIK